ncbi:MAG: tRNA (N6-threonylcarbamoyladenosine(37)-N6)-methyltransferase TrmO [Victivallaceae bacterium]
MDKFEFTPIGYVCCGEKYRFEAPRQACFARNQGFIQLEKNCNYETALAELSGFEKIWVISCFHLNSTWKPKVRPPLSAPGVEKVGVFASRSPHRPNPIGLSCVELVQVTGRRVYIQNFDLLDQTPILDIKPYIPEADAFVNSRAGWRDMVSAQTAEIEFFEAARTKIKFLADNFNIDLNNFIRIQLGRNPLDNSRKRIILADEGCKFNRIGFRTWQIWYVVEELPDDGVKVLVTDVKGNYAPEELLPGAADKYGDKDFHRLFIASFGVH